MTFIICYRFQSVYPSPPKLLEPVSHISTQPLGVSAQPQLPRHIPLTTLTYLLDYQTYSHSNPDQLP